MIGGIVSGMVSSAAQDLMKGVMSTLQDGGKGGESCGKMGGAEKCSQADGNKAQFKIPSAGPSESFTL